MTRLWGRATVGASSSPGNTSVGSTPVLGPFDGAIFSFLSILGMAAIAVFLTAWFVMGRTGTHPFLFALASGLLLFYLLNQQGRWFLLPSMRRPLPMDAERGLRVAVVTTFVPGAESLALIEHALGHLVAIRYPHDTWLLDEGNDPEVRRLCERLGARHFTRRDLAQYQTSQGSFRQGTKHGNYNAWLAETGYASYDILSAFDPDHVPHPEYLDHVLGYFRDPAIGYVQPAQAYYNQDASFIARGAAEDTYAYYSSVQMASFGAGYPIVVGGHNVHHVAALRNIEGFAPHDADDLLITLRYRNSGWRGVYVPRILASGLTPVDWRGYLRQQQRWARSVIDIKLREWRRGSGHLSARSRFMSAMQGLNFIFRGVVGLFVYALIVGLLLSGRTPGVFSGPMLMPLLVLAGAIVLQELFRQKFYLKPDTERGMHWRSGLLWYAKWPWLLVAAVDVLLKRRHAYAVTSKVDDLRRYMPVVIVHATLAVLLVVAWLVGSNGQQHPGPAILSAATVLVFASVAIVLSELRGFPAPFDKSLWRPVPDPDPIQETNRTF